jgi:hypothetical protein
MAWLELKAGGSETFLGEQSENVYENKGGGQEVEKSRSRGVQPQKAATDTKSQSHSEKRRLASQLLNFSTPGLQN